MSSVEVMSEEEAVAKAAKWTEFLLRKAHRGPGDTIERAMAEVEATYGVPAGTQWALRYRKPKTIPGGLLSRIAAAYERACRRQEANLKHDIIIARAMAPTASRCALVDAAEALLRSPAGTSPDAAGEANETTTKATGATG
jgi:hypothetical protein